jgi:hypothetical protein
MGGVLHAACAKLVSFLLDLFFELDDGGAIIYVPMRKSDLLHIIRTA